MFDHEIRISELEKSVKELQKLVKYLTKDKECPTCEYIFNEESYKCECCNNFICHYCNVIRGDCYCSKKCIKKHYKNSRQHLSTYSWGLFLIAFENTPESVFNSDDILEHIKRLS